MTKTEESNYQKLWRPSIAWSYLVICVFDFLVAPIGNAFFQSIMYPSTLYVPWSPITLGSGATYHLAMLTIVGITSYSRGQEKMKIIDALTATALKNSGNDLPPNETKIPA